MTSAWLVVLQGVLLDCIGSLGPYGIEPFTHHLIKSVLTHLLSYVRGGALEYNKEPDLIRCNTRSLLDIQQAGNVKINYH